MYLKCVCAQLLEREREREGEGEGEGEIMRVCERVCMCASGGVSLYERVCEKCINEIE